ncbi:hypothetical protein GCM10012275_10860 [Longimycelium tulufanense]|uniref:Uncharacterized protein n=1 Tax=Longimycelium tulufanense TaxID=907463 RepID=A0A8J3CB52_9PSEU|nr:hypothetical protein [Longimycelium tulufanense]GGM41725.1 hypothetical protein GCM10012275_10860 [Longimycelium tulufanense]
MATGESAETEPTRLTKLSRYTRWILPAVLLVELVLIFGGVISLSDGVMVVVILEATIALVVIAELLAMRRAVKRARARGQTLFQAVLDSLDQVLPPWGARIIRHDLIMWRAIWFVLHGQQDVSHDGAAIHYSKQLRPMFWVFFFIFPIEAVLVELLLPWPTVRLVLLILGILGIIWYLAFIATLYKYPHTIDPRTLRVRWSAFHNYSVPAAKIQSVRFTRKRWQVKRSVEVVDGVLVAEIEKETNVLVQLREPHRMHLGKHGVWEVTAVALWADDAPSAVDLIKRRLDG